MVDKKETYLGYTLQRCTHGKASCELAAQIPALPTLPQLPAELFPGSGFPHLAGVPLVGLDPRPGLLVGLLVRLPPRLLLVRRPPRLQSGQQPVLLRTP